MKLSFVLVTLVSALFSAAAPLVSENEARAEYRPKLQERGELEKRDTSDIRFGPGPRIVVKPTTASSSAEPIATSVKCDNNGTLEERLACLQIKPEEPVKPFEPIIELPTATAKSAQATQSAVKCDANGTVAQTLKCIELKEPTPGAIKLDRRVVAKLPPTRSGEPVPTPVRCNLHGTPKERVACISL